MVVQSDGRIGDDSTVCSLIASPSIGSQMAVEGPEIEAGSARDSPDLVDMDIASITSRSETALDIEPNGMTRSQAINLYASHLLSTWNIRQYEFAAVGAGSGDGQLGC